VRAAVFEKMVGSGEHEDAVLRATLCRRTIETAADPSPTVQISDILLPRAKADWLRHRHPGWGILPTITDMFLDLIRPSGMVSIPWSMASLHIPARMQTSEKNGAWDSPGAGFKTPRLVAGAVQRLHESRSREGYHEDAPSTNPIICQGMPLERPKLQIHSISPRSCLERQAGVEVGQGAAHLNGSQRHVHHDIFPEIPPPEALVQLVNSLESAGAAALEHNPDGFLADINSELPCAQYGAIKPPWCSFIDLGCTAID